MQGQRSPRLIRALLSVRPVLAVRRKWGQHDAQSVNYSHTSFCCCSFLELCGYWEVALHVSTQERERYPPRDVPRCAGGRVQNCSHYGQVLWTSHRPRKLTRFFWELFIVPAPHLHFHWSYLAAAKGPFSSLDDRQYSYQFLLFFFPFYHEKADNSLWLPAFRGAPDTFECLENEKVEQQVTNSTLCVSLRATGVANTIVCDVRCT